MCHISAESCENWLNSFGIILLTDNQTNTIETQTTVLAEVTGKLAPMKT